MTLPRIATPLGMTSENKKPTSTGSTVTTTTTITKASNFNIRHVVGMRERVIQAATHAVPRYPVTVWGEVLTTRQSGYKLWLTLRDAAEDTPILDVVVNSANAAKKLALGDMVCAKGFLKLACIADDGAVHLQMQAQSINSEGPSARTRERLELVRRLSERAQQAVPVAGPITKVTLIAPRASQGADDFRRILNHDRHHPVELRHIAANFASPDSLVGAMREAALYDEMVVVARGGGHALGLDVFSSVEVVRAVCECSQKRALVLAVGHSTDVTLSSKFASMACHTPSNAAHRLRAVNAAWYQEQRDKERERQAREAAQRAADERAARQAQVAYERRLSVRARRALQRRMPLLRGVGVGALMLVAAALAWALHGYLHDSHDALHTFHLFNGLTMAVGVCKQVALKIWEIVRTIAMVIMGLVGLWSVVTVLGLFSRR